MIKHKNYGKSVRTRLLTLMNKTGYRYMYLLTRYFNERLLYRVSVSQYKDNFLLKGGSLLYALQGLESRPTVDIDFLADRISRDRDYLTSVFKEILSIDCEMDGVKFDTDELQVEPILEISGYKVSFHCPHGQYRSKDVYRYRLWRCCHSLSYEP